MKQVDDTITGAEAEASPLHKDIKLREETIELLRRGRELYWEGVGYALSEAVTNTINRYFACLADVRSRLRDQFSPAEQAALADYGLNAAWDKVDSVYGLWMSVEDAFRFERFGEKYDVDVDAFVAKLQALPLVDLWAIAEAAQRFRWDDDADPERLLWD